jgi:hypothetical protein
VIPQFLDTWQTFRPIEVSGRIAPCHPGRVLPIESHLVWGQGAAASAEGIAPKAAHVPLINQTTLGSCDSPCCSIPYNIYAEKGLHLPKQLAFKSLQYLVHVTLGANNSMSCSMSSNNNMSSTCWSNVLGLGAKFRKGRKFCLHNIG